MKLVALKFEFTSFDTLQSTIKSTFRYFKWMNSCLNSFFSVIFELPSYVGVTVIRMGLYAHMYLTITRIIADTDVLCTVIDCPSQAMLKFETWLYLFSSLSKCFFYKAKE